MIIAVDAGGTFIKAALIHSGGRLEKDSFIHIPSASTGTKQEIISGFSDCLLRLFQYADRKDMTIEGIAFGCPGPFDYAAGAFMLEHKYGSVYGIPLMPEIYKTVDIPTVPVIFHHDLNTFAYGEYLYGAGRGAEKLLCLSIGTGVGSGYILDGTVKTNDSGGPFYSIYKRQFGTGIFEDLVSGRGITNRYKQLQGSDSSSDPKEIQLWAKQGDAAAIQTYREVGNALGEVLRDIIDEAGIDVLLFGGQISHAHSLFIPAFSDTLGSCPTLKKILPAKDIDYSSLRGAAALFNKK